MSQIHYSSVWGNVVTAVQQEHIYRVTKCMSPRRNWDSPTPSHASECAPSPGTGGGGRGTRLRLRGWGSSNSDEWRKA
jgi:hypothetical protein